MVPLGVMIAREDMAEAFYGESSWFEIFKPWNRFRSWVPL
jgi:hypothetical protein